MHNLEKRFKKAIRRFINSKPDILFGAIARIHLIQVNGNNRPLSRLYLHAHLVMLNILFDKEARKFKVFDKDDLDHEVVDFLWRQSLYDEFGYLPSEDGHLTHLEVVEFNGRHKKDIKNLLFYLYKPTLLDLRGIDWNKLSQHEINIFKFVTQSRLNEVTWYGFLADGVKAKYMAILNAEYLRLKEFLELRNRCPVCGSKLMPLPKDLIEKLGLNALDPPQKLNYPILVFSIKHDELIKALSEVASGKSMLDSSINNSSSLELDRLPHDFEILRKHNPLMPDWMIRMYLEKG